MSDLDDAAADDNAPGRTPRWVGPILRHKMSELQAREALLAHYRINCADDRRRLRETLVAEGIPEHRAVMLASRVFELAIGKAADQQLPGMLRDMAATAPRAAP